MNTVPTKHCSKCGELKPLSEYYFENKQKGIRRGSCKDCHRAQGKQYYHANRVACIEYQKQYFQDNKEQIIEQHRLRYHNDDTNRLTKNLRNRLWTAINLQGATKLESTMSLVGCSPEWLTQWLDYTKSFQCEDDEEDTHIDHFYPFSAYNHLDAIEQQKAMYWKNLRVIPVSENMEKHDTFPSIIAQQNLSLLINFFIEYMKINYQVDRISNRVICARQRFI